MALAEAIHGANAAAIATFLNSEAETLEEYGRDRGSNVHLVAAIALRRRVLALASSDDERGAARTNLGIALWTLGERESGTARLEEAVAAYRAALEERTRERVPLDWATTQNNLGNALSRLGERESGTARLEEAVAAYRAALEEMTRERVPLDWAATQNNLGIALRNARRAGERDGAARGGGRGLSRGARGEDARAGSARLGDDAEQSRQCALDARRAGERDGAARGGGRGLSRGAGGMDARAGSARLGDDAEQSRHCALRRSASGRAGRRGSRRRSRPIARRWRKGRASGFRSTGRRRRTISAMRSRRSASGRAGRRGSRRRSRPIARRWRSGRASGFRSTGRRRRTISAMRSKRSASGRAGRRGSRRRSRPIARRWRSGRASGFRSTGRGRRSISALRSRALGERESGTARLEEAVAAYRAALEELTRERVPLDWATTQIQSRQCARDTRAATEEHRASRRGARVHARRRRRLSASRGRLLAADRPAPRRGDGSRAGRNEGSNELQRMTAESETSAFRLASLRRCAILGARPSFRRP